jgi:hypothetical protein
MAHAPMSDIARNSRRICVHAQRLNGAACVCRKMDRICTCVLYAAKWKLVSHIHVCAICGKMGVGVAYVYVCLHSHVSARSAACKCHVRQNGSCVCVNVYLYFFRVRACFRA